MKSIKIISSFFALALLYSCGYKTIADASYPEQKIYIALASQGSVYEIDTRPVHSSNTPTEGSVYQYVIEKDEFIVPLSVYRSGIDNKGDVRVRISFDDGIVSSFVDSGELSAVTPVPENSRFVVDELLIPDGRESASFGVRLPLSYLRDAADGSRFAFGIRIFSEDRTINEKYGYVIVVINHKIFEE